MVLLSAGKPAFPRVVAFTPTRGVSTLNTKPKSPQRVRSSSTSVLTEIKATESASGKTPLPPLAALPTSVLLRSLLVATISSKPYLLLPSLKALSFFCKPRKGALFNVDRNPILHGILKATFYKQFCAGETPDEVRRTIQQLNGMGFQGTIMTYAKETVFDHKTQTSVGLGIEKDNPDAERGVLFCQQIEAWRKGTIDTIDTLGENDYLALK